MPEWLRGAGLWRTLPSAWITHRYLVKVYALNVEKLPFGSETPPGKNAKQIETHSIGVPS
jgi:phosphatidylethanolamine-binding protein (PEBP) family uncharacterized protein